MTLGYAGSYASGFPDELTFEQWLDRIDTLTGARQHLDPASTSAGRPPPNTRPGSPPQPGSPAASPAPAAKQ